MSGSAFQGYYQEAGRAGRDGRPSDCVLLYSRRDIPRLARMQRSKPKAVRVQDTINLTEVRGRAGARLEPDTARAHVPDMRIRT